MLGWLVEERGIEPHVKVFDKSERTDGTFSRSDFAYDPHAELYLCPGVKELRKRRRLFSALRSEVTKEGVILYRASKRDSSATFGGHWTPRSVRMTKHTPMSSSL